LEVVFCEGVQVRLQLSLDHLNCVKMVFAHFHAVALERHSSMKNWMFGLPGRILSDMKENDEHVLDFGLHLSRLFRFRRVRLMLSYLNACLITVRVSVALFPRSAQNLMLFLCQIHRVIASGQIHDSKQKVVKDKHFHQDVWNFVHRLPRYVSTIIYRCIALLRLFYRWQHQSRKLWINPLSRARARAHTVQGSPLVLKGSANGA
jgi:hypothetical protein